jgi:hypothetical protein
LAQIKTLKNNKWIEKQIVRPYLAFDGILCEALQHTLPQIIPPSHHEESEYPFPAVVFRLFDYTDVPEVCFINQESLLRTSYLPQGAVWCPVFSKAISKETSNAAKEVSYGKMENQANSGSDLKPGTIFLLQNTIFNSLMHCALSVIVHGTFCNHWAY